MWVARQFTPKKDEERHIKKEIRMKGNTGKKIREQGRKGEGERTAKVKER